MSTLLQDPAKLAIPTMSFRTALGKDVSFERLGGKGQPVGSLKGLKIFKAGTFRDAFGRQATWTAEHLQQMAFHFKLLKGNQMLANVPVREDHWSGQRGVLGYFTDLRVEHDSATADDYLVADLDITEPEGADKIERGTYRGRSLEVGMFEANDESMYWPVVLGVAFVDIPAVEGLFNSGTNSGGSILVYSEAQMSGQPATFSKEHVDFAVACAYAQGLQDAPSDKAPAVFKINGTDSSDAKAVQEHIVALEKFQKETGEAGRKSFVTALATDGKIAATQVEAFSSLVLTMSDEQFDAFKKSYEGAPKIPAFQNHGGNPANPEGEDPAKKLAEEIAVLEEIVASHKRAGVMTAKQIEETASYKRLQELKSQK